MSEPSTPSTGRSPEALPPGLVPEDDGDRRRLRIALAAAVVFHGLLFLVHLPPQQASAEPPPEPRRIYVVDPMPRVRQPEPPPEVPPEPPEPQEPRVLIPMPDVPEPVEVIERPIRLPPVEIPTVRPVDLPPIEIPDAPPAPDVDEILEVSGDVVAPVRVHGPLPRYTEPALRNRIQGTVVLRAVIGRDGVVRDIEVLKGLPLGLTERALDAVRRWRYEPATLAGRPVDVYFNLQVYFKLS
jgi:periplasmic protein TonB